jgi:hypothetical protein
MHEKCGTNCKHLQRYLDAFLKGRKEGPKNKKEAIKLHIENMNDKLSPNEGDGLNLPYIKKN